MCLSLPPPLRKMSLKRTLERTIKPNKKSNNGDPQLLKSLGSGPPPMNFDGDCDPDLYPKMRLEDGQVKFDCSSGRFCSKHHPCPLKMMQTKGVYKRILGDIETLVKLELTIQEFPSLTTTQVSTLIRQQREWKLGPNWKPLKDLANEFHQQIFELALGDGDGDEMFDNFSSMSPDDIPCPSEFSSMEKTFEILPEVKYTPEEGVTLIPNKKALFADHPVSIGKAQKNAFFDAIIRIITGELVARKWPKMLHHVEEICELCTKWSLGPEVNLIAMNATDQIHGLLTN